MMEGYTEAIYRQYVDYILILYSPATYAARPYRFTSRLKVLPTEQRYPRAFRLARNSSSVSYNVNILTILGVHGTVAEEEK
jgi:hypothetical protein